MVPPIPNPFALTWRDGIFLHWPFEPAQLSPHVPYPLDLATSDGTAWVGLLAFVATDVGLRGTPAARLAFPECNLRTYVERDGERAVYFFSIDVGSRFVATVAGAIGGAPCHLAAMDVNSTDGRIRFTSRRLDEAGGRHSSPSDRPASFDVTYRPTGDEFHAVRGSLAHWLTSPRRFYVTRNGRLLSGEVAHEPWLLQPASVKIRDRALVEAAGLPTPAGEPHALFCEALAMTATVHGVR